VAQDVQQQNEDPIRETIRLLASANEAGQLLFRPLESSEEPPPAPASWALIGWRSDEDSEWLCDPIRLHAAIIRLFRDQGRTLALKRSDLYQRMIDQGYIPTPDEKNRYTVKRLVGDKRVRVIVLTPEAFAMADGDTSPENTEVRNSSNALQAPNDGPRTDHRGPGAPAETP
jgi:hypothetical protein